ncbi:MAG: HD domain-containing protein [candidate division SR1 bacterium]|nr:HD domain-containing protein [candidate division SR1 bacterium]
MHLDSKKKNFLKVPKIKDTLVTYKEIARDNIISIFQLDDYSKLSPFEAFLENGDHGAEHTYNVFKKSLEIAEAVEKDSAVSIDKELLYMMSAMHDSGRFRLPIYKEGDTEKQQQAKENKRKKSEREHARYGVAQVKLGIKKLKEKNIMISDEDQKKIEDYVLNHDFFNERLEGDRYHEPVSLEGQIVRLADRISVPVGEEIKRYRETGKRLGTPYFKKNITWKERIDFSFVNMGEYIKNKTFDEFTFFLALLSQVPGDFSHPLLAEIYKQWGSNKDQAISCILQIAEDESYNKEDIQKMKLLINAYLEYFKIHF